MCKRIPYIDALKGVAMLLVIIGHCIAAQFTNYKEALDGPRELMLLWRIIYSFHMPLFAFCSGLLMAKAKEYYTTKNVANTLFKRAKSLLVPFGAVGCIWYFINGYWGDHYWFLIVIWECIVVQMLISWLCSCLPKWSEYIESIFLSIIAIVSLYAYLFISKYNVFPIIDFSRFHHLFPYYVVGILVTRYRLIERVIMCNWVYALALICFVACTYWLTYKGNTLPLGKITNRLIPLSAICTLTYICKVDGFVNTKLYGLLSNMGRHSLELYIIHPFFSIPMYFIGEWSLKLSETGGYTNCWMIFLIQVLAALGASVLIIGCSYVVMWVIGRSSLLSQLLLGRKYT